MQFHMRIQSPTADHVMDSLILSHSIVLSNASLEIGRNCAPGRSLQGQIICAHGYNMSRRHMASSIWSTVTPFKKGMMLDYGFQN
jgi:hypothetical protein